MIELSVCKRLNFSGGELPLEVELRLEKGSFVTLYGKSGAGKTSILRMIAGLLKPDQGHIKVNEVSWLDTQNGINLRPQKRKVGFLFQDYALFPNMTVKENLLFALSKGQDQKVITELMELIELGALQDRKPQTLSGGQQQRVALARALVQKPELLMLDEPLSALDQEMRLKLQKYLLQVHAEFGLTTILVSHDIPEIQKTSDLVLVLDQGKIVRQGTPAQIFKPTNPGQTIQLKGEVKVIEKHGRSFSVHLLIGKEELKMLIDEKTARVLKLGDRVEVNAILKEVVFNKVL